MSSIPIPLRKTRSSVPRRRGEREAVTHDRPQDGNQKRRGETLRHRCEHVLLAHHAGVKQCKTRDGHHQHETGRTDHPGGVGAIDLCVLCEGG
jgi:hypothetical protein